MSVAGKPCGSGGIYVRADTVVGWIEQTTKRKITRASCDKADGQDDVAPDASGCSVSGGGAGLPLAIVGLALMHRRRCRR